jgi:hypothetical protein
MKTDDLIAELSGAARPVPRHADLLTLARGLIPGALIAFAFVALALGLRRDVGEAMQDWQYWAKFAYGLATAIAGFVVVKRLSHPGLAAGNRALLLGVPFAAIAVAAIGQWTSAPPQAHHALMFGHSALVCPWLIVTVSLPVLAGTIWAMRKLAPTDPMAGAAAGLFAGALGAWIYAFHCDESSLVFVTLWYTAGILLTGALGYFSGRVLLRW